MKYQIEAVQFSSELKYDLAIASLGYEKRSSYLIRRGMNADQQLALGFKELHVHSFEENQKHALLAGWVSENDINDVEIEAKIFDWSVTKHGKRHLKIGVDISSMTRGRLASLISIFDRIATTIKSQLEIDFFYSVGRFLNPSVNSVETLTAAPLSLRFAGHLRRASLPIGVIIGLGYEPHRALGAFEYLEPSRAWAFLPRGIDQRFSDALDHANRQLIEIIGADSVFEYEVESGAKMIYSLDSFVFSLQRDFRIVLLPMGPKIFALACLLLGVGNEIERPAVWRVGEVTRHFPLDIEEEGSVVGVRVYFSTDRNKTSSVENSSFTEIPID